MPSPVLNELIAEVTRNREIDASAAALINGIAGRIQAAVDKALANGATEAELEPVRSEIAALKASNDQLSAAVSANTETPPPPPEEPPSDPSAASRRR